MRVLTLLLFVSCVSHLSGVDCYTAPLEFEVYQFTNNTTHESDASVYNSTIAWIGRDASGSETLYYWNGSSITQVTNSNSPSNPSLYNGTVAWIGSDGDAEIYYWDGNTIIQVTNNEVDDRMPSLHNGTIAWQGYDGNDNEIYQWNGTATVQITSNTTNDGAPSLYNGTIAWQGKDGGDYEIYYWDGTSITQITSNDINPVTNTPIDDIEPSLYNGTIAWVRYEFGPGGHDYGLYYWDGNNTIRVTDYTIDAHHPSLHNGSIAWFGGYPSDYEIFYSDGTTMTQVTDNSTDDSYPSLHNGMIVWQGHDGNDWEIFFALLMTEIEADVNIRSNVLNLKSKHKWLRCWIKLPEGYDPRDIVTESLELSIPSCSSCPTINPTRGYALRKHCIGVFSGEELVQAIEGMGLVLPTTLKLEVNGDLMDGPPFEGSDTIWVTESGS